MILEIDGWKFDIDLPATMEYSAAEAADHCTCAYCRNFYEAIDDSYPDLRPFLAQFGINIEAPDELMNFEPTLYLGAYAVTGRILRFGTGPIRISGAAVLPETSREAMVNAGCQQPYFVLTVGLLTLPWILDEPPEDVVSPGNEPSFLRKMWNKLLKYRLKDDFPS